MIRIYSKGFKNNMSKQQKISNGVKKFLPIIIILFAITVLATSCQSNKPSKKAVPIDTATKENVPTSADNAPPGTIHNLEVPIAVAAVRTLLANKLNLSEGVVIIMSANETDFLDTCLGLAKPGEDCAEVVIPGYDVILQANGVQYIYRATEDATEIRQEK